MRLEAWTRAAVGVAATYALLLVILHARIGLAGLCLWYVGPSLVALSVAVLLAIALLQSMRARRPPAPSQLGAFFLLALVALSLARFTTYPSSHDHGPSNVTFRLPLDGPVTVAWGGPSLDVNYHVTMPDQRWAYDLLVTVNGRSFHSDGRRLEDYHAYGRPVLAPADGIVRDVRGSEPDAPIGNWQVRRATGNHVIIEVAPREFLFVAHLQRDSIPVTPRMRVRARQPIGRVGNSGNSSEPHVHVHLQDTPDPYFGEGVPMYFHGYRVGGVLIDRGMPSGGRQPRSRWRPGTFTGDVIAHGEH